MINDIFRPCKVSFCWAQLGLSGPPVLGQGKSLPGSQVLTALCVEGCGEVWGCMGMHGRTMETIPPHYICTPPQLYLWHFISQGDTQRKGGQMEVSARMMRSCGRTHGGLDPLNPFCGALPLAHLPEEQQRSSRLQAAWGILQQLQWHPAEEGSLGEAGSAWLSLQILHRPFSLHSSCVPKSWEHLPCWRAQSLPKEGPNRHTVRRGWQTTDVTSCLPLCQCQTRPFIMKPLHQKTEMPQQLELCKPGVYASRELFIWAF